MGSLKRRPKNELISPDASKGFENYKPVPAFRKSLETMRKEKVRGKRRARLRASSIETGSATKGARWPVQGGLPGLGKRR